MKKVMETGGTDYVLVFRREWITKCNEGFCSSCVDYCDKTLRVTPCNHLYCMACIREILNDHKCPSCKKIINSPMQEDVFIKHPIYRSKYMQIKIN